MKTTLVVFFALVLFSSVHGQSRHSLQINGGIIMPMKSSKGLMLSLQYNYPINSRFQLYTFVGYSCWDKFKAIYTVNWGTMFDKRIESYSADEHVLIPFYAGTTFKLHTNKLFSSFLNFEMGYARLSYNQYKYILLKNEQGYITDISVIQPGVKMKEDLLDLGIGGGLSWPVTEYINLIVHYKLNSFLNMKDNYFLTTRSIYSSVSAAFDFKI